MARVEVEFGRARGPSVSLAGNTAGTLALVSSGTLLLAGGNNITLSQNGQRVTISGGAGGAGGFQSAGVSNLGNTFGTTGLVSQQVVFFGGNNISLSQSADAGFGSATVSLIAYAPVVSSEIQPVSSETGSGLQTSRFAAVDHAHRGVFSAGVSNLGNTVGDTGVGPGQVVFQGGNNITLSQVTAIGALRTVVVSAFNQSVQPEGTQTIGMSNLGNSVGTSGVVTGTGIQFIFAGGNNITLSQSIDASSGTITISAFNQSVQPEGTQTFGISNLGNSVGTSGVITGTGIQMILAGGNNITLSQSINGSSATITVSAFNQSSPVVSNALQDVSTATGSGTNTSRFAADDHVHRGMRAWNVNGIATTFFGDIQFSAGALISLATGGNSTQGSLQIINVWSLATTVSQVDTANAVGAMASRVALEGHVHRGVNGIDVNGIASTFYGTVQLSAGAMISLATGGASTRGSMQIIDLWSSATTASVVASDNVVGAMASRVALEGHQHAGVFSIGVSTGGNTSGNTTVQAGQLVLAGGNAVTLSQATAAGRLMTVTISAGNTASTFQAGVSNLGNTAGSTTVVDQRLVLVGTHDITLSQSTAAGNNSATVTIVHGPALSFWQNLVAGSTATSEHGNAFLHVFPLAPAGDPFPGLMTLSSLYFNITGTVSTGSGFTRSLSFGIYTLNNSTQLSRVFSASTTWGTGAANMNINDSMAGWRWVTVHSSQFDVQPTFSQTQYWAVVWQRSSSGAQTFSYFGNQSFMLSNVRSGFMNAGSVNNTTNGWFPFLGRYSVSFATAMPAALAVSDIDHNVAGAVFIPHLMFNNTVATNIG